MPDLGAGPALLRPVRNAVSHTSCRTRVTRPSGVWRWYDAVVLGEESGLIRLWEPSHGEVVAQAHRARQPRQSGTRAYLSAGLPAARAEDAAVELDEVERFYTERDLWNCLV